MGSKRVSIHDTIHRTNKQSILYPSKRINRDCLAFLYVLLPSHEYYSMIFDKGVETCVLVGWGSGSISGLVFGLCFARNPCSKSCSQVFPKDFARRILRNGIREENFIDPLVEYNL